MIGCVDNLESGGRGAEEFRDKFMLDGIQLREAKVKMPLFGQYLRRAALDSDLIRPLDAHSQAAEIGAFARDPFPARAVLAATDFQIDSGVDLPIAQSAPNRDIRPPLFGLITEKIGDLRFLPVEGLDGARPAGAREGQPESKAVPVLVLA